MSKLRALRFGMAASGGDRAGLEGFVEALSVDLGREVTGLAVWNYARLVEAMDVGDVDIAWLPPILALSAAATNRVVPIALPVRGGVTSYSTALFARENSRPRTLDELVALSAAWVDRQSTSGFLLIRAHLRSLGIDLERAFTSERFLGSHEAVAQAVLDGRASVGATFVYVDGGEPPSPVRAGWGRARVEVLAVAGPIPADVIAIGSRLATSERAELERALLEPSKGLAKAAFQLLRADGFVTPTPRHLEPLLTLLPALEGQGGLPPNIWPRQTD